MSYRTYINGHEWLGNNNMYEEIYQELVRQGCPFDEDGCVVEPFEVKDLDGLVKACEKVIVKLVENNKAVANFNETITNIKKYGNDLTLTLQELQNNAYIFISANLLNYVGEYLKEWEICWSFVETENNLVAKYRLTDKGKCLFEAY